MATSRTGTGAWRKVRAEALRLAQDAGLLGCPDCLTPLDYVNAYLPCSAEVDHIVPVSMGGTDELGNLRVVCRRCNQRRGNALAASTADASPAAFPLSARW